MFLFINAILFISFFINSIKSSSIFCFEKPVTATVTALSNRIHPCIKCKWFIPNPNLNSSEKNQGLCKKFKKFNKKNNTVKTLNNMYEYAIDCRRNEFQCGTKAYYFEPIDNNNDYNRKYLNNEYNDEDSQEEELSTLQNQIKEMEELNCGEVNEKRDLEDWETEYNSIKKRIEKLLRIKDKKQ